MDGNNMITIRDAYESKEINVNNLTLDNITRRIIANGVQPRGTANNMKAKLYRKDDLIKICSLQHGEKANISSNFDNKLCVLFNTGRL